VSVGKDGRMEGWNLVHPFVDNIWLVKTYYRFLDSFMIDFRVKREIVSRSDALKISKADSTAHNLEIRYRRSFPLSV
jgi:hypothetical protein